MSRVPSRPLEYRGELALRGSAGTAPELCPAQYQQRQDRSVFVFRG